MPYLNCPNCRLTLYTPVLHVAREECPRCAARLGKVSRLFRSDIPHRLASELEGSTIRGRQTKQA